MKELIFCPPVYNTSDMLLFVKWAGKEWYYANMQEDIAVTDVSACKMCLE